MQNSKKRWSRIFCIIIIIFCSIAIFGWGFFIGKKELTTKIDKATSDVFNSVNETSIIKKELTTKIDKATSDVFNSVNETSIINKNSKNKIIYQDDNIIITYKGIKNNYVTKDIQFLIENLSNKSISVYVHEVSINNFSINTMMSTTLSANTKSNQDIAILNSQLKDNDIIELSEINFELQIHEKNDYLNKIVTTIHFSL